MFLQALAEYADNHLSDELKDSAWQSKPVPWLLEISPQGQFLAIVSRTMQVQRGEKQVQIPVKMRMPRSPVNRNRGHYPLLGTDDITYVLGVGPWTAEREGESGKAEKHHQAFVALIGRAAAETGDAALEACAWFYRNPMEVEKARCAFQEAKPGTLIALSVGGALVDRKAVQGYWRQHYQTAFSERMEGGEGECMISGKLGPIAPTHEKIQGVGNLGGLASGVALMSFDKEAFRSYGWVQNQNSPVLPDRALAYVLAFNHLLEPDTGRRTDIAGIAFLQWLRKGGSINVFQVLDQAEVKQPEDSPNFDPGPEFDANRFYMLGVSGNGGRLRARYWVDLAPRSLQFNLQNWHQQLRVEYPWNHLLAVPLWRLLYALDREGKPPAHIVLALLRRAIEGLPLGYSVLSLALTRLRGTDGKREDEPLSLNNLRVPVGLIRMCLNDLFRQQQARDEVAERLNRTCSLPGYLCGRLHSEFENLQQLAHLGEMNSSFLDRYFFLASTCPAVAFPRMEMLAQKNFRKLRRERPGSADTIEARLQEIFRLLRSPDSERYPEKFDLEGQGLFALGFYHQKAWSIAQSIDHKHVNEIG